MKLSLVSTIILLTLSAGFACKKKSNDNPFANSRIATADVAHAGSVEHYHLFYDTYNNVDSVSIVGDGTAIGHFGYLKYIYFGSSYSITNELNYSFTVYASTGGVLLKVLNSDSLTYVYASNLLAELDEYKIKAVPPYYTKIPTYFTWLNGDLSKTVIDTETRVYTYNTGKNGQPGDALRIPEFLKYGRSSIKTTHLPAGYTISARQGATYLYSFDGNGRISNLAETAYSIDPTTRDTTKDVTTYSYTYY